jgi:hypothetical protein
MGKAVSIAVVLGVMVGTTAGLSAVAAALPHGMEGLAFLLGRWDGVGGGAPGQGAGSATFASGLQDHVIIRDSFAEYPASSTTSAVRHDDLMIIFPDAGGGIGADYYDSEGHHIHYAVTVPAPQEAVFQSDTVSGAPRFRLTYKLGPAGHLQGEFAIAPPGKPEEFARYLAWESIPASGGAPATGR